MKNNLKKAVAVVMAGAVVFSLTSCSVTNKIQSFFNEVTTTTEPFTNKSDKPNNELSVIQYFNRISENVKSANPFKVNMNRDFSAGGFECENEILKASLPTVKKFMLENNSFLVKSLSGSAEEVYPVEGEKKADILTLKNVNLATCVQKGDEFIVTIELINEDSPSKENGGIGSVFNLPSKDEILKEFGKSAEYLKVNDYSVRYVDCKIVCTVDRQTDNILSANYSRTVKVTADVTGTGTLEAIGNQKVSFDLNETENYEVLWTDPEATTAAKK